MDTRKIATLLALCLVVALASIMTGAWATLEIYAPERAFSPLVLFVPWAAVIAYGTVAVP